MSSGFGNNIQNNTIANIDNIIIGNIIDDIISPSSVAIVNNATPLNNASTAKNILIAFFAVSSKLTTSSFNIA